jgi:hypothetical protein
MTEHCWGADKTLNACFWLVLYAAEGAAAARVHLLVRFSNISNHDDFPVTHLSPLYLLYRMYLLFQVVQY